MNQTGPSTNIPTVLTSFLESKKTREEKLSTNKEWIQCINNIELASKKEGKNRTYCYDLNNDALITFKQLGYDLSSFTYPHYNEGRIVSRVSIQWDKA